MSASLTVIDLATGTPDAPEWWSDDDIKVQGVGGRCHGGWTVSLSAAADDDIFFQILPNKPDIASWRPWSLTITAPSGAAAQIRTWAGTRGQRPSVETVLAEMHLSGPIAHVFAAQATAQQRAAGWDAIRVFFAALRSPAAALVPSGLVDSEGVLAWAAAGFTLRARREWRQWVDAPDVAADYRLAGFDPVEAERWSGLHECVPADLALAFQHAGWDWVDLHRLTVHLGRQATVGVLAAWLSVPAPGEVVSTAAKVGLTIEEATRAARHGSLTRESVSLLRALTAA